jgi:hypothetical protein
MVRVSALALPQFAEGGSGTGEAGNGGQGANQDISGQCLAVVGIRVTCFPWIQWLLLTIVLAADGWLIWSSLRGRGKRS